MSGAGNGLPVRIRPCQARDLRALEWGRLYCHHRAIIEAAYRRQRRGANLMLLAELTAPLLQVPTGFPVGQLWLDLRRHGRQPIALLWAFRVLPSLCGRGIGTRLLLAAETWLRTHGYRAAEIGVEVHNLDARRLYERRGYQLLGPLREIVATFTTEGEAVEVMSDQWLLRKWL